MAKQTRSVETVNHNAHMSATFFLLWLVNAVVLFAANLALPMQIVFGTMSISSTSAIVLSSGILAWLATVTLPLFTEIEIRKNMVLTPAHWLAGYLVINIAGVWLITRFADIIGLGVASWMYVVLLAILLDVAQGIAMMAYGNAQKT